KVNMLERFDGDSKRLALWLVGIELYYRFNGHTFAIEEDRILSAIINIKAEAAAWAEPFLTD
ncbi:hypothetical protein K491DRAFT_615898, partial [Lophiostoma macrostomum CBS 122681]